MMEDCVTATFSVRGRGATTNEAYRAAKAAADRYTGGEEGWALTGESYHLDALDWEYQSVPVICVLDLSRAQ